MMRVCLFLSFISKVRRPSMNWWAAASGSSGLMVESFVSSGGALSRYSSSDMKSLIISLPLKSLQRCISFK